MKMYEAFAVSNEDAPLCRAMQIQPEEGQFPSPAELADGVLSIAVRFYGDDTSTAFIHVIGNDQTKVKRRWMLVRDALSRTSVWEDWE